MSLYSAEITRLAIGWRAVITVQGEPPMEWVSREYLRHQWRPTRRGIERAARRRLRWHERRHARLAASYTIATKETP